MFKSSHILSFLLFPFFIISCKQSEAERLGIKWCECQTEKAALFENLDKETDPAKINSIVNNIMLRENEVVECMGGEDQLKLINKKFRDTNFQEIYDKTRKDMCPEIMKLLEKKNRDRPAIPTPIQPRSKNTSQDTMGIDSTNMLSDSILTTNK